MKRFWDKVDKSGDCWLWTGAKHKQGYGVFGFEGKIQYSHRIVLKLSGIAIPAGMCVCHTCDNPPCVNPDHLFIGSHTDNMADRDAKGRGNVLFGENHGMSKLTDDEVAVIRRNKGKITQTKLAELFGVTQSTISLINLGKTRVTEERYV